MWVNGFFLDQRSDSMEMSYRRIECPCLDEIDGLNDLEKTSQDFGAAVAYSRIPENIGPFVFDDLVCPLFAIMIGTESLSRSETYPTSVHTHTHGMK